MITHRTTSLSLRSIYRQIYQSSCGLRQALFPSESADYIKWRHEFLYKRLNFGLWLGLICFLISSSHGLYLYVFKIEQIRLDLDRFYEAPWMAEDLRDITVIGFFLISGVIISCLWIQQTRWGRRYPAVVFLIFAGAVNGFLTQLISTFYDVPVKPETIVFLAFAVLLPLRWPLHILAQLLPITYYVVVLPLLGITHIGDVSIFNSVYNLGTFIQIGWVCLICNVGVYVYERLRRSEFESRRELQIFLHAISHDLRNPVMGTSIVVKGLLDKVTDGYTKISAPTLERLLQGSDRQIALINALVEAYHADEQGLTLNRQPLQLSYVVSTALADVESKLAQDQVELHNLIEPNLPLVSADQTHLWRVFSNLIDNALKHNPPGIQLTLAATVVKDNQLLCHVQDNGVGIPHDQCKRLFDLYARGSRARYMPGLGLGLYLCKQIITAHGGNIGVSSQLGQGTTFWFTLPLFDQPSINSIERA